MADGTINSFRPVYDLRLDLSKEVRYPIAAGRNRQLSSEQANVHGRDAGLQHGVVVLFVQIGTFSSEPQHPCGFAANAGRSKAGSATPPPSEVVH